MQIDRRVTNGLAWAGLFLVVGVPAADLISARLMGDPESIAVVSNVAPVPALPSQRPTPSAVQTAMVEPAKPAVSAPVAKPVVAATDAVDNFLSSGKQLPSYISGGGEPGPAPVAAKPQPVAPVAATPGVTAPAQAEMTQPAPPVVQDPVEVASITPQKVAPIPMPLSMRPTPVPARMASQPAVEPIVIPQREVADYEAPVTGEDLEGWEYGPLSDFLERRQGRSAQSEADTYYDEDGFFLDDGPNRRPRRDRYLGPADGELYFPFVN